MLNQQIRESGSGHTFLASWQVGMSPNSPLTVPSMHLNLVVISTQAFDMFPLKHARAFSGQIDGSGPAAPL